MRSDPQSSATSSQQNIIAESEAHELALSYHMKKDAILGQTEKHLYECKEVDSLTAGIELLSSGIWHGLVDYRKRLAGLRVACRQQQALQLFRVEKACTW